MLKPKKRITKREIKQDGLISMYSKVISYYDTYKKYVNYGLTAAVVIVIALVIYSNNKTANNEKAATELGKVFSIYDNGSADPRQYQIAIEGQPERGILGLKAIVENYGSTESGELARFYLAGAYLNIEKYDEALKYYDSFDSDNDLLSGSALAGMAICYEAKNEFEKAASSYEKASAIVTNQAATPDYMHAAALCYARAGEKEKAVSLLKRIKKEYPKSQVARDVDRYISQFSA